MNNDDFLERLKNTGRNDICPCGSGKKYKKCHLSEDEAARSAQIKKEKEAAEAETKAAAEKEAEEGSSDSKKNQKTASSHQHRKQSSKHTTNVKGGSPNLPRRSAV